MPYRIVVIEDNSADVYLLENALKRAGIGCEIHPIEDGEMARSYIREPKTVLPDFVILVLHLPRIDGMELLRLIRQQPSFESVPVMVWSSLSSPKDSVAILEFQGTQFISKPSSFDAFLELGALIGKVLTSNTLSAARSAGS